MLDADRRELSRSGEPVTMPSRTCDLLLFLLRNRDRAIDSDDTLGAADAQAGAMPRNSGVTARRLRASERTARS